jgi:hypothetical protein
MPKDEGFAEIVSPAISPVSPFRTPGRAKSANVQEAIGSARQVQEIKMKIRPIIDDVYTRLPRPATRVLIIRRGK